MKLSSFVCNVPLTYLENFLEIQVSNLALDHSKAVVLKLFCLAPPSLKIFPNSTDLPSVAYVYTILLRFAVYMLIVYG